MRSVLRFSSEPPGPSAIARLCGDVAGSLLLEAPPHSHAVQFYEREEVLYDSVAQFLLAGLAVGDALIVIATAEHRAGFLSRLARHGDLSETTKGQLLLLDVAETLDILMVGDTPNPFAFRALVEGWLACAERRPGARVRAYGEMVDVLWRRGEACAAIRLEELWAEACREHDFALLCAYGMSNFYRQGNSARFLDVCRQHTHVIPTESFASIAAEPERSREACVSHERASALEKEVQRRKEVEAALCEALWERARVEGDLRAAVKREREARALAEAGDSFKELILSLLGHDLKNPLNAILSTASLMDMGNPLSEASRKRLRRVLSSGKRMQRMIEQMQDMTRARMNSGIVVEPGAARDLVPLVAHLVGEASVACVDRTIELFAPDPCMARVDQARFEQVVSTLLSNAVAHGDPEQPISVDVTRISDGTLLSVHNFGRPIAPERVSTVFEPPACHGGAPVVAEGLGLGLYIAERIVSAHGGRIDVESSAAAGTQFRVILPSTE